MIRLTRQEILLVAEAQQRGPTLASLVLAFHSASDPSPDNEYLAQISSHEEYAAALEQPISNKLTTYYLCILKYYH